MTSMTSGPSPGMVAALAALALLLPSSSAAQGDSAGRDADPGRAALAELQSDAGTGRAGKGFRVFIVPDMEGAPGTVFSREVLSGAEADCETCFTSPDYEHYRRLMAEDVNAVIEGASAAGATAFTVNEGHGGNDFANIQPFALDPRATLVRGWPKPLVMITGLDATYDTVIFIGAHANAGSPGVMAHNFAVDSLTVNGVALNEVGLNALVAGEMGVSVSLVSGDDVLVEETHEMIGQFEEVVTKIAYGRNAAATYTPARVREWLRSAARRAVEGERKGAYRPFTLEKPYRVAFTLRKSFADKAEEVAALSRYRLERTGAISFRFETQEAVELGHLMNDLELIVF
ncbi:MAG: M55 family metallopeptidase [Gemmatimonadetes bacterium]|nr:M55 family metallopeptidase [Gemmatimonadota bacterium]